MKRVARGNGERLEYTLVKSDRKNVLMKVLPGGEVRVWAPRYGHLKDIDSVVAKHISELKDMIDNVENALRKNRLDHPIEEGSCISIEGVSHRLHRIQGDRMHMEIKNGMCILTLAEPNDEEQVRAALKAQLAKLALVRIREKLNIYAPIIGVNYNRVTIRDQKSRWGSCSSKHNLNFNWKLIMAPPEALEYVVIHELCHLIEFSHSPKFWSLVGKHMPEYEYWKKWLKEHGSELGVGE